MDIKFYLLKISDKIRNFFYSIKNIIKYIPLLYKDYNFDYCYMLSLEQFKLKRMYKYFITSDITEDDKHNAEWINKCIKLIDIIKENDTALEYDMENPPKYSLEEALEKGSLLGAIHVNFLTKYINEKNAYRFLSGEALKWHNKLMSDVANTKNIALNDLRIQKAWYLYNKIRYNLMFNWWN